MHVKIPIIQYWVCYKNALEWRADFGFGVWCLCGTYNDPSPSPSLVSSAIAMPSLRMRYTVTF